MFQPDSICGYICLGNCHFYFVKLVFPITFFLNTVLNFTVCVFLYFFAVSFLFLLFAFSHSNSMMRLSLLSIWQDRVHTSNKDIQLTGVSYVLVCLCSEVWDYEIIGWENGLARAKRTCGTDGKGKPETWRRERKWNKITSGLVEPQKGQGNINRVGRLNWQSEVKIKKREKSRKERREAEAAGQTSLQSSQTVYMQPLLGVSVCAFCVRAHSSCLPWVSSVPALQVGFAFLIDTVCSD